MLFRSEPVEQFAPDEASGQGVPEAELDDDDSDPDDKVDDGGESDDSDTESAVICGGGPLLTNAQISVGVAVAVPFTLDGRQVHFEGTISATTSSSKVKVTFPGERPWVVARDRLFEVVALTTADKRCDHDMTAAARESSPGGDDDDDMAV